MAREMKLKYVCHSFSTPITQDKLRENGEFSVYGASGIMGYNDSPSSEVEYLGIIKDGAGVGRINSYPANSSLLGTMAYIVPNKGINIGWLRYVISNMDLANNLDSTTIPHIYFKEYGNKYINYVDSLEQERIASYLDKECIYIDSVIDKTRSTIEEYKALKQSIITEAVTKGIRGERAMKDSGVEWIGEIPDDWEKTRVKNLGRTQNGISKSSDEFGKGYPFVSYGDVYKNYELPCNVNGLVNATEEDRNRYSVCKGDIFFTRTSETIEEVGFSSVCNSTIKDATFAGFLIRLRPYVVDDILLTSYAKYYFRGSHIREYLVKEMNLVTRASLSQGLLGAMTVLVPPQSEQTQISEYLDYKCNKIDALIEQKERLITELESYKKSLIYEYVTGKKEVPDLCQ